MPPAALIGGAVAAPIIGNVIGQAVAGGDVDQQKAAIQAALQQFQGINAPELQKLLLEKYQSAGQLTPEQEATISQNPSLMGNISTDPRLMQAQMQALNQMGQVAQGGLRPEDMAALQQIQRQSDQDAQAKQGQILQEMQQRGQAGSGAELAARLIGGQQSANRLSQQGLDIGSQASQRALQALSQYGGMGAQMQSQQFNQQSQVAQAQDAINRFNSANAQQVQGRNVDIANQGQLYNLGQKQGMMNANTQLGNQQNMYNTVNLPQQQFANQMQLAQGRAGQYGNMGNFYGQQADQARKLWSQIGQGVGSSLGGVAAMGAGGAGGAANATQAASSGAPAATYQNVDNNAFSNSLKNPNFGQSSGF